MHTTNPASAISRPIVLASTSPRRREFLRGLGLNHTVRPVDLDETPCDHETPTALARRLAVSKAAAAAQTVADEVPGCVIVAADTVVAQDSLLLGKPADAADAVAMLTRLRAGPHQVISAVCVLDTTTGTRHTLVDLTRVVMRAYTDAEIAAYVASGDPLDKAGAYGIQSPHFAPVATLEGCYASVMGLPLRGLVACLGAVGIRTNVRVSHLCAAHGASWCCAAG